VLQAADGLTNCAIAERLGICEDTARKWRRRYCEQGIEGLADAPRPGRPRVVPRHGGSRGQGPGVRDARRDRNAAGPLDLPRTGPPCRSQRHHPRALAFHRALLACR
jgi:transposase-like protein